MSIAVLRQMFEQMVEKKDPTAIEQFYHPSFVMFSNGVTQDFEAFTASHRTVYSTEIRYSVEYDEDAWVETRTRSPRGCGSRPAVQTKAPPASRSY